MTDTQRSGTHGSSGQRGSDDSGSALDRAREAATDASRRTAEALEANPLGILVGGLAVGAVAGALLPRTEKEKELLAPVGQRLSEGARAAVSAAKDAARSELETRGFTADAGREQAKNLFGGLGKALSTAGAAAAKAAVGKGGGSTGEGGQQAA